MNAEGRCREVCHIAATGRGDEGVARKGADFRANGVRPVDEIVACIRGGHERDAATCIDGATTARRAAQRREGRCGDGVAKDEVGHQGAVRSCTETVARQGAHRRTGFGPVYKTVVGIRRGRHGHCGTIGITTTACRGSACDGRRTRGDSHSADGL